MVGTVIWRATGDHDVVEDLAQETFRLPLIYAAIDELDHGTIARMLKFRRGTVKTLVFRGRQLLKERVDAVLGLQGVREAHAD
jgi:DNA-directed RNA polymerase specialized sigma24 family protein